jgi:hypothetical protein
MNHRTRLIAGIAALLVASGITAADEARDAKPAKAEPQKKATAEPAKCTHAPGSHIKLAKPEDCSKAARGPYRSYSKQDIENTGETNLADALRKLDPSFR